MSKPFSFMYKLACVAHRRNMYKHAAGQPAPMPMMGPIAQVNAMNYGLNPQVVQQNPGAATDQMLQQLIQQNKQRPSARGACSRFAQEHSIQDPNIQTGPGSNVMSMANDRNYINPSQQFGPGRSGAR